MSIIDPTSTNPDTGVPYTGADVSLNQLVPGYASATTQLRLQGARLKILTANNPVLADNLGLASQIANTPVDDYQLSQQAVALSGVNQMATWLQTLSQQSPTQQRATWLHMTPQQQQGLGQLGYSVPEAPHHGGGGILGGIGDVVGGTLGAVTGAVRGAIEPALDFVGEVSKLPSQLYRSVRTSEPWIQYLAYAGGLAAALALAPETGGVSLGAFATASTEMLAGAGLTAGAASTLYGTLHGNPQLWIDTWNAAADGERVFTKGAQRKAAELVGNDLSVQALARDLAFENPYQLTSDLAGTRNSTEKEVLDASIQRMVSAKFPLGSPQFQDAYQRMTSLRQDPKFMSALRTLQDGKISFGRDLARQAGLDPGSAPYTLLSGAADATFMIKTDPLLQLGRTAKAYQSYRYGMGSITSAATLESRLQSRPVRRAMEIMADAVREQNPELIRRSGLSINYPDLIAFDMGHPVRTVDDVVEFYKSRDGFRQLLEGQAGSWGGTGLQLPHVTVPRLYFNNIRGALGDAINFADDRNVARMVAVATGGDKSFSVTKPFEQMAGVLKSLSTKIPTNPFINLSDSSALREVHQLTELGRFMGMNSEQREVWYNLIMSGPSPAARTAGVRAFYANMFDAVGANLTVEGHETMEQFLTAFSQKYKIGEDALRIGGTEIAAGLHSYQLSNAMAVPDLQALRHAVNRSVFSKALGMTDAPWIEASMAKVWKPLTLMRIGFIPRVAGDEIAGFIARRGWKAYAGTFGPLAVAEGEAGRAVMAPLSSFDRMYAAAFGHLGTTGQGSSVWVNHVLGNWSDWARGVLTTPEEGGGLAFRHIPGFGGLDGRLQRMIVGAPDALRYQWLHGNDPDVIAAARHFVNEWGTSLSRSLSAAHFQSLTGVPAHQLIMQVNAGGATSEVAAMPISNHWGMIGKGDAFFNHWAYAAISKPFLGEEGAIYAKHLAAYASPSVVDSGVDENLLAIIRGEVGPDNSRLVANILAGSDRRYIEHELARIPEIATLSPGARKRALAEARGLSLEELATKYVPEAARVLPVQSRAYIGKHLANWTHLGAVPEFITDHGELERRIIDDLTDNKLRTENANPARSFRSRFGSESEQPVLFPTPGGIARMYAPALDASTFEALRDDPNLHDKLVNFLRAGGSANPNVNAIIVHFAVNDELAQHLQHLTTAAQINDIATVGLSAASLNDYRTAQDLSSVLHGIAGVDRSKVTFFDLPESFRHYKALPEEQLLGNGVRMRSIDPVITTPRMHVLERGGYTVPGGLSVGGIDHTQAAEEWARAQWRDVQVRLGVGADFQEGMGSLHQLPGEYLHEGMAPSFMDIWDAEDHINPIALEHGVPLPRLTMSAVHDMTPRLPPSVPGTEMQVYAGNGKWADFKTNMFRHMSSTIDAIARKPIAFDRFLNAYRTNMASFPGLLDTEIWGPQSPLAKMALNHGVPPRQLAEEFNALPVKLQRPGASWETVRDELPAKLQPAIRSGRDVAVLRAAGGDLARTQELAVSLAKERTIREVMPFIHEPAIRSQFQEYTRNLFPFFFAQEQFMRRWAGTLLTSPEALRGAQMMMNGLRSVGAIHSDGQGHDMFYVPGSGMLTEILNKMPGVGHYLPFGDQGLSEFSAMASAPIAGLNPGLGHEFGSPSAGPLLSIPLDKITKIFPELLPIDKALTGGFATNRTTLQTLMPTPLARFYRAFFGDETDQQYAAAMVSVAQILDAQGFGLKDDSTVQQREAYMDRLRNQSRNMVLMQAIVGFISPSAPRTEVAPADLSLGAHLGVGTIRTLQAFRSEYGTLVRNLGLEKGHQEFVRRYPDSTLTEYPGIIDPNALTVAASHNRGLAHLPATHAAFDYYHAHSSFLDDAKNAAGWFLPPGADEEEAASFDISVYQDQIAHGLRVRQAPEEFVTALKFASAAGPYFESQQNYQDALATLTTPESRQQLTNDYNAWKAGFLARRPIFAQEIANAQGAQRRQATMAEMRQLVYVNPDTGEATVPVSERPWHFQGLKDLQDGFDRFTATLGQINAGRTKVAQEAAKQLKLDFADWATHYVDRHPEVASYWTGVLAPEANLG